jgi:hypothetical protein
MFAHLAGNVREHLVLASIDGHSEHSSGQHAGDRSFDFDRFFSHARKLERLVTDLTDSKTGATPKKGAAPGESSDISSDRRRHHHRRARDEDHGRRRVRHRRHRRRRRNHHGRHHHHRRSRPRHHRRRCVLHADGQR